MLHYDNVTLTLAQDDVAPTPTAPVEGQDGSQNGNGNGTGQEGAPGGFGGSGFIFMLLGLMVLMFIMTSFSNKKEKRRRAEMLESLKKNDKVVTIGGVIGTVVEVKTNEITLKVDESSNTRMRFNRSAIQGVMTDDDMPE